LVAINAANAADGGNVVLTPQCTYNLTNGSSTGANGRNGLPIITTVLTPTGDQNLITRSGASDTAVSDRRSRPNRQADPQAHDAQQRQHADAGNGMLNFGEVTLTGSELTTLSGAVRLKDLSDSHLSRAPGDSPALVGAKAAGVPHLQRGV
jgi:hypothetical protein